MTWRWGKGHVCAAVFTVLMLAAAEALAQAPAAAATPPVLQLGVAVLGVGSTSTAGSSAATLIRPDGTTLTLFSVDSRVGPALGMELSVTRQLGARVALDIAGTWAKSEIRAELHDDFEGAAPVVATDRLQRITAEASLAWTFARPGLAEWYVRAGGGWLRDLAGRAAVPSDGGVGNVALGVKYWWRAKPDGAARRVGIRVEGRATTQLRGQVLGPREARIAPAISAGVVLGL